MHSYVKMDHSIGDEKRESSTDKSQQQYERVEMMQTQRGSEESREEVLKTMMREIRNLKMTVQQLQMKRNEHSLGLVGESPQDYHRSGNLEITKRERPSLFRTLVTFDSWKEWAFFIAVVAGTAGGLIALAVLLSQQLDDRSLKEDVYAVHYGDPYIHFDLVICQNLHLRRTYAPDVPCQPPLVRTFPKVSEYVVARPQVYPETGKRCWTVDPFDNGLYSLPATRQRMNKTAEPYFFMWVDWKAATKTPQKQPWNSSEPEYYFNYTSAGYSLMPDVVRDGLGDNEDAYEEYNGRMSCYALDAFFGDKDKIAAQLHNSDSPDRVDRTYIRMNNGIYRAQTFSRIGVDQKVKIRGFFTQLSAFAGPLYGELLDLRQNETISNLTGQFRRNWNTIMLEPEDLETSIYGVKVVRVYTITDFIKDLGALVNFGFFVISFLFLRHVQVPLHFSLGERAAEMQDMLLRTGTSLVSSKRFKKRLSVDANVKFM